MKKSITTVSFSLIVLLLLPLVVHAQGSVSPNVRNRVQTEERVDQKDLEKEDVRVEVQKRVEERKASQEAKLMQKRQERIRNHWGILERRINATIERLETLISRIESRLTIVKSDYPDLDTTKIESDIETAKEVLVEARMLLASAEASLEEVVSSENPNTSFLSLKNSIKDIKDMLVEAHRILVFVIGDIKGLHVGTSNSSPTPKATTATVTPTTMQVTPSQAIPTDIAPEI